MINRADYQIQVTDPVTGDIQLIFPLTTSYNLRYSLDLNDVGAFALSLDNTAQFRELFSKDTLVDIYRSDWEDILQLEATYLVRAFDKRLANNTIRLIVSGVDLNHFIDRRIIDPADDSLAPESGYSTKAGLAGNVIRDYINEQLGEAASTERQIIRLTVPAPNATGFGTGGNYRYENLLEEMAKLAAVGGVDFRIVHTGGAEFECIIGDLGNDNRIPETGLTPYFILDPQRGNISELALIIDGKKERNYVYSLGEGEGTARNLLKIGTPAVADSPYNRIEYKEDKSNDDPFQQYLSSLTSLREHREEIKFEFKIDPSSYGIVYRRDIGFADKFTAQWDGLSQDVKITGIDFSVEGSEESIELKVTQL